MLMTVNASFCYSAEGGGRMAFQPHSLRHSFDAGRHDVHGQYSQPVRNQH